MQPAGRRQAQTRARPAERHAFVGNHAEMTDARDRIAHGCGVHWRIGLGVLVAFADQAQQLLQADELLQEGIGVGGEVAHAHQLDEAQLVATFQAVIEQRHHLIQVLPAQRHHVDLDLQARRFCLVHAIEHGRQVTTTGDAAERTGVEGIEGHVDPAQTGVHQQRQLLRQELTVSGQADVFQAHLADGAHERFEFGADQRLTAGDTQTLNAGSFDQVSDATSHGLGRQFILRSHQPLAVGHAVGTGVIAG